MLETDTTKGLKKEYRCKRCGETDRSKFYPYISFQCKKCLYLRVKEYRKGHPEWKKKQSVYYKKWYANGGRKDLTVFKCPKCGETDPKKFYRNRRVCKPCQNRVVATWRKSHHEYAEYQRKWWAERRKT